MGRRTRVRIGHLRRPGLLTGQRIPGAEPALVSLSPAQIACPRSRDSCHRVTTRPSWRAFPPATVAAFASSPAALAVLVVYSQGPRLLARAARSLTAGSARRADGVSPARGPLVRCAAQAQGRAVAQPCAPVGAPVRHLSSNRRAASARDVTGCQPSGDPVRALTLPIPPYQVLATVDGWIAATSDVPLRGSRRAGLSSRVR